MNEKNNDTSAPWILLIRHSDFFTTGMYLERVLQKKYNVISIYLDRFNLLNTMPSKVSSMMLSRLVKFKTSASINPDLILVVDPVRKKFDFSSFNAPTVYYAADVGRDRDAFYHHIKDVQVQNYDYVFVAQKDFIPAYKEKGCKNVYWLPHACDPEIHRRYDLPSIYDICFIGSLYPGSLREQLVRKLEKEFNVFVGRKYLHDMAKTFSRSKMIFNESLVGDLNMRIFEAMSCGSLLLTNRIRNGLEEMFTDRKHLVIYDEWRDLVNIIRYYLDHPDEREQIALNGQKEVHQKHTYTHRMQYLLETVLGK